MYGVDFAEAYDEAKVGVRRLQSESCNVSFCCFLGGNVLDGCYVWRDRQAGCTRLALFMSQIHLFRDHSFLTRCVRFEFYKAGPWNWMMDGKMLKSNGLFSPVLFSSFFRHLGF
jgi:hypothetical protein